MYDMYCVYIYIWRFLASLDRLEPRHGVEMFFLVMGLWWPFFPHLLFSTFYFSCFFGCQQKGKAWWSKKASFRMQCLILFSLWLLFAENEFATATKQRIVIGTKEWDVMYMFEVKKNGANFSGILKKWAWHELLIMTFMTVSQSSIWRKNRRQHCGLLASLWL